MSRRTSATRFAALLSLAIATPALAQQRNDEEYTKQIKQFLRDPRITTELVDHLPASSTVPTPLKHFGHIMGAWGVLDKAEAMHAYLEAINKAAPARTKFWKIGKTEEGRDMVVFVVASEEIIRNLDNYRKDIDALTDPRKTTDAQAAAIIRTSVLASTWTAVMNRNDCTTGLTAWPTLSVPGICSSGTSFHAL